ncbi:MAG: hypothetical protein RL716_940 [Actinomycetota bacterium]|jgi:hypothetical protein
MIFLKASLLVILEMTLFASLGNGNFNLPTMFNALFYASFFGLPIVVMRYAIIHSLFAKESIKIPSLDFWKYLLLYIGPCVLWASYLLTSSADSWANSWLPLSLLGYVASELIAFLLILRPRHHKH